MKKKSVRQSLQGKVLAFGGVYSNLQALEKLQEIAGELDIPPSNIICTGDVAGYCAQPEASVQLVREWGIHCIAGNVELQLREGLTDCGCNFTEGSRCDSLSQLWYPYALSRLSPASIGWMKTLPEQLHFQYGSQRLVVLHGSAFAVAEFIFASTPWEVKAKNFEKLDADCILAGHFGLPFHSVREGKSWLNPGVTGMPANDGTPRVWYMLLDEQEGAISWQHCAYQYDFNKAYALMQENGLPAAYADTLRSGLWDNCEILPAIETAAQGRPLSFGKATI